LTDNGPQSNISPVMEETTPSYAIRLPAFEGPLDLLLHLIKKNEIDIYDIPMASITRQYLEYLDLMKSLNLNLAGEFLVMAATLIHLKSKTLLPPAESEEEEGGVDPRAELVRRLLEYQQFKEAAGVLEERELSWRDIYHRSPMPMTDDSGEEEAFTLGDVSLYDLLDVLKAVFERIPEKHSLEIFVEELSVQDRMDVILDGLEAVESVTFTSLFEKDTHRLAVIVTFLALLELVRLRQVKIVQGEVFGVIRIWKLKA
jgi:segregation and condensation protein A